MYIKNIVIDGFKTYGKRTEINGFNESFNAITGLNGSGKSNILDSICFVLGLSNMSLARVSNLRELIYKNGQTGVTKASVTLTFDNKDKNQSPTGYEQYDDIVIRREVNLNSRTRYYINGFTASNSQVLDLFHSVQLNINNPHFLIMQGRITKVLNMKPSEILAMVEEATGVSMYESKKKATRVLIEKKDLALKNIDSLIAEAIKPKLEQLSKEQTGLLEFQQISKRLEQMTKIFVAWQFLNFQKLSEESDFKINEKKSLIDDAHNYIVETIAKVNQIEEQLMKLEKQKDLEFGGKLSELEAQLKEAQMAEAKLSGDLNLKKDNVNEENKKRSQLEKNLKDDLNMMTLKKKDYAKLMEVFEKLEETRMKDEKTLEQAQKDFEAIVSGMSKDEDGGAASTLADQMMQAKREIAEIITESTKTEMKLKHSVKELSLKKSKASKKNVDYEKNLNSVQMLEKEVENLQKQITDIGFDKDLKIRLELERESLKKEIDHLENEIDNLENRLPQISFEYKKPSSMFETSKVHGIVCSLFNVKDPKNFTAIEVAAAARLYNVVVKDESTAKLILEKGQLKKRYTFLPLDKIQGKKVDRKILEKAKKLVGDDKVEAAIDLIEFDPSLTAAMYYVFGDTFVCSDINSAKQVTFSRDIQKRSVTIDGEVFDPSGTLSGGAIGNKGNTLSAVNILNKKKHDLYILKSNLTKFDEKLDSMKSSYIHYSKIKDACDLKLHELDLLKNTLKQTDQALLMDDIENLEKTIEASKNILETLSETKAKAEKKVADLQTKMQNSEKFREKELKNAEAHLTKCKKNSEETRANAAEKQQEVYCLKLEIDELHKSIDTYNKQIEEIDKIIENLNQEVELAQRKVNDASKQSENISKQVKEQKRLMNEHSGEMNKLAKEKDVVAKSVEEKKLLIKKFQHEITQIEKEEQDAVKSLKVISKKNPWIEDEKHLFDSDSYGLNKKNFNPTEFEDKIKKLQASKASLAKTVNMRANIMLGDKEKEYDELSKKRDIIEDDKQKLICYMEDVDKKKKDALHNAWLKINKDFGNIFSTLLPGTNAILSAPEGKTVFDGLEVKVAFGDVWKESLTELSGGQRSLVALSLILALLLYNPAPIYILDEVDAALDQSHTQNIGIMIKKHFTNSQFIIVSLKDDMFNNANVLFRTKFIDGYSSVTRFVKGDH